MCGFGPPPLDHQTPFGLVQGPVELLVFNNNEESILRICFFTMNLPMTSWFLVIYWTGQGREIIVFPERLPRASKHTPRHGEFLEKGFLSPSQTLEYYSLNSSRLKICIIQSVVGVSD